MGPACCEFVRGLTEDLARELLVHGSPADTAYLSIYLPIYLSICLSTYLPIYLSTFLPFYLSTYLPSYTPTYLPTFLPTYLPTYLSIYLSLSLSLSLSLWYVNCGSSTNEPPRHNLDIMNAPSRNQ